MCSSESSYEYISEVQASAVLLAWVFETWFYVSVMVNTPKQSRALYGLNYGPDNSPIGSV